MELQFHQETKEIWKECLNREDSFPVALEGVVPDINEDVSRVASVQSTVLLKSRELEGQILRVGGEVEAVVLYITENADRISSVRLTRDFTREIELPEDSVADESQALLRIIRTETRILNPRKLAVSVEVGCNYSVFRRGEMVVSLLPTEEDSANIYGRMESADAQVVTAVTEKSFAVTESFVFPQGKAEPVQILSSQLRFHLGEHSRIGSRLIIKGTLELQLCYAAEGVCYPLQQSFTTTLSQILDPGVNDAVCCTVTCQPTALYLELSDSIGGDKTLSCEVHALLQAVCRSEIPLQCYSDAYSVSMPAECSYRMLPRETAGEMQRSILKTSELFSVSEDCADVLAAFTRPVYGDKGVTAEIDVIYRSKNGDLAAVRRQLPIQGDANLPRGRILSVQLIKDDLLPEGEGIQANLEAELVWQPCESGELRALHSVVLDEEHPYDLSALPAVTLVHPAGDTLWELARSYHSSVEAIEKMNKDRVDEGKMLLIPRV